jgi:hypothetical protein
MVANVSGRNGLRSVQERNHSKVFEVAELGRLGPGEMPGKSQ